LQLAVLVLDFEQPHILDRDHRLVSEGRGELDLPDTAGIVVNGTLSR
jgi:hypothetical protein